MKSVILEYLKMMGRKGGMSTSPKKRQAAKLNGLKGGRPKGSKNKIKRA